MPPNARAASQRAWIKSQPRSDAIERGEASAKSYLNALNDELARPAPPLEAFKFDDDAALRSLEARAKKEADAAEASEALPPAAAPDETTAEAAAAAAAVDVPPLRPPPEGTPDAELPLWRAFCEADPLASGSIGVEPLKKALASFGLKLGAKERRELAQLLGRDAARLVEWPEFRKLGRKFAVMAKKSAAEAEAKEKASRTTAATRIQSTRRGQLDRRRASAARDKVLERKHAEIAALRRKAMAVYAKAAATPSTTPPSDWGIARPPAAPVAAMASASSPPPPPPLQSDLAAPLADAASLGATAPTGASPPLGPATAMLSLEEREAREAAARDIQRIQRGKAARVDASQARTSIAPIARGVKNGGASEEQLLSLASALCNGDTDAASAVIVSLGGAKKGAAKKAGKAGASAKKPSATKAKPSASKPAAAKLGAKPKAASKPSTAKAASPAEALSRAMLATAFAAVARPGGASKDQPRIPLRLLSRVLESAGVPRAETVTSKSELTADVELAFDEVADIAAKLRSKARPAPPNIAPQAALGSVVRNSNAPKASDLRLDTRRSLAAAFAQHDNALGSVASSSLPQAYASIGVYATSQALEMLLGTPLSDARRIGWDEYMQLAATIIALQPGSDRHLGPDPKPPAEVIVTVEELHLAAPPVAKLLFLAARLAVKAGEPAPPPLSGDAMPIIGPRTKLNWRLALPPTRALTLGLFATGAGASPTELAVGEVPVGAILAAVDSRRAASRRAGEPARVIVPLVDTTAERGSLVLAVAPAPTETDIVRPPGAYLVSAPRAGAEATATARPAAESSSSSAAPSGWALPAEIGSGGTGGTAAAAAASQPGRRDRPANLSTFEERLWRAFQAADVDGSGAVSRRELDAAVARLGLKVGSKTEQIAIWKQFDRDGSGKVEWPEFVRVGKALRELAELADGSKTKPSDLVVQRGGRGSKGRGALTPSKGSRAPSSGALSTGSAGASQKEVKAALKIQSGVRGKEARDDARRRIVSKSQPWEVTSSSWGDSAAKAAYSAPPVSGGAPYSGTIVQQASVRFAA